MAKLRAAALVVLAEYNRKGYRIFISDGAGLYTDLYQAGNSPWDSQQALPVDHESAVPLKTLRKYAIQTGQEHAKERGLKFGGAERVPDDDA